MLELVKHFETERWNEILERFPGHDISYTAAYCEAFMIHGDGEPLLFYYQDGDMEAMNVVMKRDIADFEPFRDKLEKDRYYDLSTPYGYGGFLVRGEAGEENLKNLDREYTEICRECHIVSEFCRFHPIHDNSGRMESVYEVARLGKTVNLDLRSPEQILGNMDRRKRQQVLRALEAGVRVYWGLDENLPEPFMEMYNRTMDKNNAKSYYYFEKAFFESLVTGLKTHTMFFYARVEGAIAAMCIIFYYNGIMNGLLLSSNEIGRELVPVNLMIYEAALWGAANGYTDLHIGSGVGGKNDSLYVFKKKFNKHSDHDFIIGKKIFDKSAYQELITLRESEGTAELDHGYFPEYRG